MRTSFTPADGETYVLKNAENIQAEFSGNPIITWAGVLENTAGEVLGEYVVSDMKGTFDVLGFGFESGEFGWAFSRH